MPSPSRESDRFHRLVDLIKRVQEIEESLGCDVMLFVRCPAPDNLYYLYASPCWRDILRYPGAHAAMIRREVAPTQEEPPASDSDQQQLVPRVVMSWLTIKTKTEDRTDFSSIITFDTLKRCDARKRRRRITENVGELAAVAHTLTDVGASGGETAMSLLEALGGKAELGDLFGDPSYNSLCLDDDWLFGSDDVVAERSMAADENAASLSKNNKWAAGRFYALRNTVIKRATQLVDAEVMLAFQQNPGTLFGARTPSGQKRPDMFKLFHYATSGPLRQSTMNNAFLVHLYQRAMAWHNRSADDDTGAPLSEGLGYVLSGQMLGSFDTLTLASTTKSVPTGLIQFYTADGIITHSVFERRAGPGPERKRSARWSARAKKEDWRHLDSHVIRIYSTAGLVVPGFLQTCEQQEEEENTEEQQKKRRLLYYVPKRDADAFRSADVHRYA
jgi:hypothetical protein